MSRLNLVCLHCRHRIPIEPGQAGRVLRCPQCAKPIRVPASCPAATLASTARQGQPQKGVTKSLTPAAPASDDHFAPDSYRASAVPPTAEFPSVRAVHVLRCPDCGKKIRVPVDGPSSAADTVADSRLLPRALATATALADQTRLPRERAGLRLAVLLIGAVALLAVGFAAGYYRPWASSEPVAGDSVEVPSAPTPAPVMLAVPLLEKSEAADPDAEELPPPEPVLPPPGKVKGG